MVFKSLNMFQQVNEWYALMTISGKNFKIFKKNLSKHDDHFKDDGLVFLTGNFKHEEVYLLK